MKIPELAKFIKREDYMRTGVQYEYDMTQEKYNNYNEILHMSRTAPDILSIVETPMTFFYVEETLKKYVPKEERTEFFYSLKNGFIYEGVPSYGLYYVKKIYDMYKVPNLIFKLIPPNAQIILFSDSYLQPGITWAMVLQNLCDPKYMPITEGVNSVVYDDFVEVYIAETDMIAKLPRNMRFSFDEVRRITVDKYGLLLDGNYLALLGGRLGTAPKYDLTVGL